MGLDEQHLEQLLKAMPLRQPSDALNERITTIEEPPPLRLRQPRWLTVGAGMAAMIVIGVMIALMADSEAPIGPAANASQSNWMQTQVDPVERFDQGVIRLTHTGTPVHRVRETTTRRVIVNEPDKQAVYVITIPQHRIEDIETEPY